MVLPILMDGDQACQNRLQTPPRAAQGHSVAQFSVVRCYQKVQTRRTKAFEWFQAASPDIFLPIQLGSCLTRLRNEEKLRVSTHWYDKAISRPTQGSEQPRSCVSQFPSPITRPQPCRYLVCQSSSSRASTKQFGNSLCLWKWGEEK